MILFVIFVIGDLARIFLFGTSKKLGITSSSWDTTFLVLLFIAPLLVRLLLLFFSGFLKRFFDLKALFSLVGLTLPVLEGCARFLAPFKLIVLRIEAYL